MKHNYIFIWGALNAQAYFVLALAGKVPLEVAVVTVMGFSVILLVSAAVSAWVADM